MGTVDEIITIFRRKLSDSENYSKCLEVIQKRIPGWTDIGMPVQVYAIPDYVSESNTMINDYPIPLVFCNKLSEDYWKVPISIAIGFRIDLNRQLLKQGIVDFIRRAARGENITTPPHTLNTRTDKLLSDAGGETRTLISTYSPVIDFQERKVRAILVHNLDASAVLKNEALENDLLKRIEELKQLNRKLIKYNKFFLKGTY